MEIFIILYILIFVLGLSLGSFANAMAYRLKENMSFVFERSQCPKCKKKLSYIELIPVFSYLIQKGKCKGCHERISLHYMIFEIVFGIYTVILGHQLLISDEAQVIKFILLLMIGLFVIIIVISDFLFLEIPDEMNLMISIFVGVFTLLYSENILFSIIGGVFASLFFFTIFKYTGENKMGFGDVKMVFGLGLLFGIYSFIIVVIFSSLFGIIYGLAYSRLTHVHYRKVKVPLGSMLGLVSLILILVLNTEWGMEFLSAYNSFNILF